MPPTSERFRSSRSRRFTTVRDHSDVDGNEVPLNIPDGGSVISAISVIESFFISDVNVEVDIDHEWGPDLRVYLRSPGGQRVELIRDLGSQVRGGQIYGVKYDDLNGDGQRDEDEPGLPGWTIFIDTNNNGDLDPGERSTVTDSEGRYSFVNLDLNQTYKLVEIPQAFWQPVAPVGGAPFELYGTDFSNGSIANVDDRRECDRWNVPTRLPRPSDGTDRVCGAESW